MKLLKGQSSKKRRNRMSDYRHFLMKAGLYDHTTTQEKFLDAVKKNIERQMEGSDRYRDILMSLPFVPDELKTIDDIGKIPPIPTLFFKRNEIFSVDEKKLKIKATSSGTTGSRSVVGFDLKTLYYGIRMALKAFRHYGILSPRKVNYILLGYEPSDTDKRGAVKTAAYTTRMTRRGKIDYFLRSRDGSFVNNIEGLIKTLDEYSHSSRPVRFVGFPGFLNELADELIRRNRSYVFDKRSMVLLGGGWKGLSGSRISSDELANKVNRCFGIREDRIVEFFSAVEHPVAYVKCRCGHFHMPVCSMVIARDKRTLEPLGDGKEGILNFITPLVDSMPLISVLTDDIGTVCYGKKCDCGNEAPYFTLSGRADIGDIVTCSNEAVNELKNG